MNEVGNDPQKGGIRRRQGRRGGQHGIWCHHRCAKPTPVVEASEKVQGGGEDAGRVAGGTVRFATVL